MNSIVVAKLFRVPLRPRFPELGNVLSGLIRSTRQKLFRPIFLVFIFYIFSYSVFDFIDQARVLEV